MSKKAPEKVQSNDDKTVKIIWERTKRPVIFVVISLLAMSLLIKLEACQTDYGKRKKSPIVITDEDPPDLKYVRTIPSEKVVEKIKNPNGEQKHGSLNEEQIQTIRRGILEIQYQNFSGEDEMIGALNGAVIKSRDIKLASLQNSLFISLRAENEIREEKMKELFEIKQALTEFLEDNVTEVDIESFVQIKFPEPVKPGIKADGKRAILTKIRDKSEQKKYTPQELIIKLDEESETLISKSERANITNEYKNRIENVASSYQPIFRNIYLTKGKWESSLQIKKDSASAQGSESKTFFTELAEGGEKLFFDDNGKLSIAYKLLTISLNAVIVFALLFIILIPVRRIFFLSGSADTLTGKATEFLALKKISPLAPGIIPAIFPTLVAIGIGSAAVVVVATQFPTSAEGLISSDYRSGETQNALLNSNITSGGKGAPNNKNSDRNFFTFGDDYNFNDQSVQALTLSLNELKGSVNKLEQRINNAQFGGNVRVLLFPGGRSVIDTSNFEREVNSLRSEFVGRIGDPTPGKSTTLFSGLEKITEDIGDSNAGRDDSKLFGKINRISDFLGTADYYKNINEPNNGNLLTRLNGFSNDLANLKRVVGSAGDDPGTESLVGINKSNKALLGEIKTGTEQIAQDTVSIQRNQVGRDGKNIITQVKTLFWFEQYLVTNLAYEFLKQEMAKEIREKNLAAAEKESYDKLLAAFESLSKQDKTFKKKELKKILISASNETAWKRWDDLILRLTRTPRY